MTYHSSIKNKDNLNKNSIYEINNIIADRVRYTRSAHHVSVRNVADIITYNATIQKISKASINFWENCQAKPTVEALLSFSDLFGVSINWLVGRTDKPYNKENLLLLERAMFCDKIAPTCLIQKGASIIFPPKDFGPISEYYLDETNRNDFYSATVRGNIIFALNSYIYYLDRDAAQQEYFSVTNNKHYKLSKNNSMFMRALLHSYISKQANINLICHEDAQFDIIKLMQETQN